MNNNNGESPYDNEEGLQEQRGLVYEGATVDEVYIDVHADNNDQNKETYELPVIAPTIQLEIDLNLPELFKLSDTKIARALQQKIDSTDEVRLRSLLNKTALNNDNLMTPAEINELVSLLKKIDFQVYGENKSNLQTYLEEQKYGKHVPSRPPQNMSQESEYEYMPLQAAPQYQDIIFITDKDMVPAEIVRKYQAGDLVYELVEPNNFDITIAAAKESLKDFYLISNGRIIPCGQLDNYSDLLSKKILLKAHRKSELVQYTLTDPSSYTNPEYQEIHMTHADNPFVVDMLVGDDDDEKDGIYARPESPKNDRQEPSYALADEPSPAPVSVLEQPVKNKIQLLVLVKNLPLNMTAFYKIQPTSTDENHSQPAQYLVDAHLYQKYFKHESKQEEKKENFCVVFKSIGKHNSQQILQHLLNPVLKPKSFWQCHRKKITFVVLLMLLAGIGVAAWYVATLLMGDTSESADDTCSLPDILSELEEVCSVVQQIFAEQELTVSKGSSLNVSNEVISLAYEAVTDLKYVISFGILNYDVDAVINLFHQCTDVVSNAICMKDLFPDGLSTLRLASDSKSSGSTTKPPEEELGPTTEQDPSTLEQDPSTLEQDPSTLEQSTQSQAVLQSSSTRPLTSSSTTTIFRPGPPPPPAPPPYCGRGGCR